MASPSTDSAGNGKQFGMVKVNGKIALGVIWCHLHSKAYQWGAINGLMGAIFRKVCTPAIWSATQENGMPLLPPLTHIRTME